MEIRSTNPISHIIDFQGTCDLCCYCDLDLTLGLVVRKHLAAIGIRRSEVRWSSSYKSISEVKGYSDWNCSGFFPLVMLALGGPEEALILVW